MKKHLIFASTALGLVLAGPASAQDIDVLDNNIAAGDSAAFDDENTVANNGSLAVADTGNGNDLSEDNSINDSGNTAVADSLNTTVTDSGNTVDSNNTHLDLDAVVSVASLSGTVSGSAAAIAGSAVAMSNTVDNGAFASLSGINQNSQNTGANSLVQQNVNVQANMRLSSDG